MKSDHKETKFYGILAAMDWNSHKWQAPSTDDDLANSSFGFVVENGVTYTSLNFAHELYVPKVGEYYSGLVPHFYSKTPDSKKFKDVKIVFLRSKNWQTNSTYIVGFYAFPIIHRDQKNVLVGSSEVTLKTNLQALPKDIHLLNTYIDLSAYPGISKLLPEDKKLGKRGYNYLTKANVERILDAMRKLNPGDRKFDSIMLRLLQEFKKG